MAHRASHQSRNKKLKMNEEVVFEGKGLTKLFGVSFLFFLLLELFSLG